MTHNQFLAFIKSESTQMHFNTAFCFVLSGSNLLLLIKSRLQAIKPLATIIAIVAVATGSQYLLNTNLGVDTFLIKYFYSPEALPSDRMGPNTASNLFFSSLAFILAAKSKKGLQTYLILALLGSIITALGIVPFLGYLTDIEPAKTWGNLPYMAIHTAACFILLGLAFIIYSFNSTSSMRALLPIPILAGMLVAVISFSHATKLYEDRKFSETIQIKATTIAFRFKEYVDNLYESLHRMENRWEAQNGTSKGLWISDAKQYLHDYPSLEFLAWVNNKLILSWIVPEEKFKYMIGTRYDNHTGRINILNNALRENSAQMTKATMTLPNGTKGFLFIYPLNQKGYFDGFLLAFLNVNNALNTLFANDLLGDYFLSVNENGIPIYNNLPQEFNQNWSKTANQSINGRVWEFRLTPKETMLSQRNTSLYIIELAIGVFISIMIAIAIFFSLKAEEYEQQLIMSQERLQAIMDASNHSIISTDLKGTIQLFNHAAERMLGYQADEMIGKKTPELIHDANEVLDRNQKLSHLLKKELKPGFETFVARLNQQAVDEQEWTYVRKDQTTFPVLLSISALHNKLNEVIGYVGIAQDISERKEIERMKNEFVSIVSHELRTPLTSIHGALGLLINNLGTQSSEKERKLLGIAYNNCERLLRLINNILDIEKIESKKMTFHIVPVNLNHLATEVIQSNEPYAKNFEVILELIQTEKTIFVKADNDRLIQVFTNLLSNAIKFSPKHSKVTMRISSINDKAIISITDQGPGIPISFQNEIFQKFSQAASTPGSRSGGTGLGLSISKTIVEELGGKIYFTTEAGKGTTFFVEFLMCPNSA